MEGKLFALDRDLAKRVFACKDDQSISELVAQLIDSPDLAKSISLPDYRDLADAYESIANSKEASGLGFAILGGRPMYKGEDWIIRLVRPDITRGLAGELTQMDADAVAQLGPDLQDAHSVVAGFYSEAAAGGAAVLFAASTP